MSERDLDMLQRDLDRLGKVKVLDASQKRRRAKLCDEIARAKQVTSEIQPQQRNEAETSDHYDTDKWQQSLGTQHREQQGSTLIPPGLRKRPQKRPRDDVCLAEPPAKTQSDVEKLLDSIAEESD